MRHFSAPATLQQQVGITKEGKPVFKLFRFGVNLEIDPDREGYMRPRQMSEGRSSFKLIPNSYVGLGLPGALSPVTVAAASPSLELQFNDAIQRPGFLGHFYTAGVPAAPTLFLTEIKINGNSVLSGRTPAGIFDFNTDFTPLFGHFIDNNSNILVIYFNAGGAPQVVAPGWSLL